MEIKQMKNICLNQLVAIDEANESGGGDQLETAS